MVRLSELLEWERDYLDSMFDACFRGDGEWRDLAFFFGLGCTLCFAFFRRAMAKGQNSSPPLLLEK